MEVSGFFPVIFSKETNSYKDLNEREVSLKLEKISMNMFEIFHTKRKKRLLIIFHPDSNFFYNTNNYFKSRQSNFILHMLDRCLKICVRIFVASYNNPVY